MQDELATLFDGNDAHVDQLPDDYFDDVRDGQRPPVVSVCCSDSRVSQEGMWNVEDPGWLFTPSNIGNRAWDDAGDERVVDGNLLYPVAHTGTRTVAVVGHTGCGAVTAAYEAQTGDGIDDFPGIEREVRSLLPVVEDAIEDGVVDPSNDDETVVNRLVEYNVDRQVAFLRDAAEIPDETSVYGFVYDFQRIYGDVPGRAYLVNLDGETDADAIAAAVDETYREHVRRLREA
jgi:carbonic anhydrase